MASILTDILDESRLTPELFKQHGYRHQPMIQLFSKDLYHYTDDVVPGQPNVIGIRKAYLTARVHFWDDGRKVRIDCKLIYITSSHDQRCINCGSVSTVKDLFDKEFWALATIKRINEDYIRGRYNWPDYEYTVQNIF